jgi:Transmembrane secretion effector
MVLVLMSIVPNLWIFLPVTALAGISWTVKASELWIAGQQAMPDWARGRMKAVNLMASQGGVALGGVLWGGVRAEPLTQYTKRLLALAGGRETSC